MAAMDPAEALAYRRPYEELEQAVIDRWLTRSEDVPLELLDGLRYVLSLSRVALLRDRHGRDVDLRDAVLPLRRVVDAELAPQLGPETVGLWPAIRALPAAVREARATRRRILSRQDIEPATLRAEVCTRKLVVVLGGGGGSGYGYGGLFTLLDRNRLRPDLVCGTSIGALAGIFRARRLHHDPASIVQAVRGLTWQKVFSVGPQPSRYGLPATLRLHLRRAIGSYFLDADGHALTVAELPIPTHIVATGLKVGALKHELEYYEHFLDDAVRPGLVFRASRLAKLSNIATILREFMSEPEALTPVVFGADELTRQADCVDAAGFSAAVTGLIHYDILRDDPRMRALMDELYATRGITRLTEGGVVANVPADVAFRSVMDGNLGGHRNPFILALDCFAPRASNPIWYPVQQLVRANVLRSLPYAHLSVALSRTLGPMNLVPGVKALMKAARWTMHDLEPHLPRILEVMRPIADLPA